MGLSWGRGVVVVLCAWRHMGQGSLSNTAPVVFVSRCAFLLASPSPLPLAPPQQTQ
jgi:hypothetical protein